MNDNHLSYGMTKADLLKAGVPLDPDAPVKRETWNVTIRLHIGHAGGTVQNGKDFTGLNRQACIDQALVEITTAHGGSYKWELMDCFLRK